MSTWNLCNTLHLLFGLQFLTQANVSKRVLIDTCGSNGAGVAVFARGSGWADFAASAIVTFCMHMCTRD